jgi:tRNA pseudouridine55 synthase
MTHGVLVVDKPSGPTSHDMVRVARRLLSTRSIGHAGTLDPLASGVLVLGVGEGTKLLQHLTGADKSYLATVRLGAQTDTLDAAGRVVAEAEVPLGLTLADVTRATRDFVGRYRQQVPEFSAIKQDGTPLYARVRRGEQVQAPERDVVVHELEILHVALPEIELRVCCAKGFYVRSLARDLARALGSLGHLTRLRRTHSGSFSLAESLAGAALVTAAEQGADAAERDSATARAHAHLLPLAAALRDCERCVVTAGGVVEIGHGRPILPVHRCDGGAQVFEPGPRPIAIVDESGVLCALGRADGERVLVVRGIHASGSAPSGNR